MPVIRKDAQSMPVSPGDEAPDFELMDQHGRLLRLRDLRAGKSVLVVFYPWAFTGVCGGELHAIQAHLADLATDKVELVAVSTDSMYALRAFADNEGFTFPMLSDFWPHGAVADAYGVLHRDIGVALRGTFLLDQAGVVRWSVLNDIGDARDVEEYKLAVAALSPAVGATARPLP